MAFFRWLASWLVIVVPFGLIREGERVRVTSTAGTLEGTAGAGPCRRGHAQAFWPECNSLLGRKYDPASGEPDYNTAVKIERAAS